MSQFRGLEIPHTRRTLNCRGRRKITWMVFIQTTQLMLIWLFKYQPESQMVLGTSEQHQQYQFWRISWLPSRNESHCNGSSGREPVIFPVKLYRWTRSQFSPSHPLQQAGCNSNSSDDVCILQMCGCSHRPVGSVEKLLTKNVGIF